MAAEPAEDPFSDLRFPHILRSLTDFDPSPETQGSELLNSILESLALKGSKKLLDQALAIRLCSPGIENLYSEAEGVASTENSKEKDISDLPLGRRLALGRKRPLFHTQRGISLYKCHLSTNTDTSDAFRASQGAGLDRRISCPATILTDEESSKILHFETTKKEFSHATRVNNETSDDIEEGSIAEMKKPFKNLSDKLFSSFDYLDGGNGGSLLKDKFLTKSADVNVMTSPEMDSMRRDDLETLKSAVRDEESQLPENFSPTTTMRRQVVLKGHQTDLVSATDNAPHSGDDFSYMGHGESPLSSTSGITGVGASTPVVVSRKRSSTEDKMDLPVHEAEIANDINIVSEEELKHINCQPNASTVHDGYLEKEVNGLQLYASVCPQPEAVAKNLTSILLIQNNMDVLASPLSRKLVGNSSRINVGLGSSGSDLALQDEGNTIVQGESRSDAEVFRGKPTTPRASLQGHGCSENQSILPEENKEIRGFQEAFEVSPDMEPKRKTPPSEKNNKKLTLKRQPHSEGQSLAEAGLTWKSGVRQSTRRKSTPLRHRLNEGYIYGQIDNSKPTTPRASFQGHGCSENQSILPEENKEIWGFQEASEVSPDMEQKRKTPPSEKNNKKLTSKRQPHSEGKSLADAGLTWKSGVRQSTRRKSTPLKHRLNEGYIYGQIDNSLLRAVGLKFTSPCGDSESLKVSKKIPCDDSVELAVKTKSLKKIMLSSK